MTCEGQRLSQFGSFEPPARQRNSCTASNNKHLPRVCPAHLLCRSAFVSTSHIECVQELYISLVEGVESAFVPCEVAVVLGYLTRFPAYARVSSWVCESC